MKQVNIIDFGTHIEAPTAITTGNFDGVHTGHRKVLETLNDVASQNSYKTVLITFKNHPRTFFSPTLEHQCLTTFEEKSRLLSCCVDYVVHIPFEREFSELSATKYMQHLQEHFSMQHYIAGHDHHIGNRQDGTFETLQKIAQNANFAFDRVEPLIYKESIVSSTEIKHALETGDVETAEGMLGYRYQITGTVIKGRQLGRQLGYPTANVVPDRNKFIPKPGVYAAFVYHKQKRYSSMLNIGFNPTVSEEGKLSIEAHIFDFDMNIYGEIITIEIFTRYRDELKFASIDELSAKLEQDRHDITEILRREEPNKASLK